MATKNGTSGDDELEGTINDDVIHGLGGDDDLSGGANDDDLFGDAGDDFLKGGRGEDRLFGGSGDDDLIGGPEGDRLDGGEGIDTVSYSGADGVTADLTTGFGSGDDASQDIYVSIENLFGSVANDVLIGNAGANEIDGSGGDDLIAGGGGDDRISGGGSGADVLDGGAGNDFLDNGFDDFKVPDRFDGGDGFDTVFYGNGPIDAIQINLTTGFRGGDAVGDVYINVEAITGSFKNDTLVGDAAANTFNGNQGNDQLIGRGGADTLDGAAGIDLVGYIDSAAGVTVDLVNGTGTGGEAEGDKLEDVESIDGSFHNDTLIGAAGTNRLRGSFGNDTLRGGTGGDILDGGSGSDTASYAGSAAAVVVSTLGSVGGGDAVGDTLISIENLIGSAHNDTLQGGSEANRFEGGGGDDTIIGGGLFDTTTGAGDRLDGQAGNDHVVGTATNDFLFGGDGADWLYAGDGTDRLQGDAGRDRLSGKGGADTYVYALVGDSKLGADARDIILDFNRAEGDRIDLSQLDAAAGVAGNQAFVFIGEAGFSAEGQVRVVQSGGNTLVNFNIVGVATAEAQIELAGLVTLTAADFVL